MKALETLDVEVTIVSHAVRQQTLLERPTEFSDCIIDAVLWLKTELSVHFFGVDVIAPVIVRRKCFDGYFRSRREFLANHRYDPVCNLSNLKFLIADIEDLVSDRLIRCLKHQLKRVTVVLNVEVGTELITTEHSYLLIVDGMVCQDVD